MKTKFEPTGHSPSTSVSTQRETIYSVDPMHVTEATTPDGRRLLYFTFDKERLAPEIKQDRGTGRTFSSL